jgi:hypothetical protein
MKAAELKEKKYQEAIARNVGRFTKAKKAELKNYVSSSFNQAKMQLGVRANDESLDDVIKAKLDKVAVNGATEETVAEDVVS